jgi:hypothetical protein
MAIVFNSHRFDVDEFAIRAFDQTATCQRIAMWRDRPWIIKLNWLFDL